ncbi:MAG: L-threonylcarbamoyladenylate synthase [Planctomycetota bacterium]
MRTLPVRLDAPDRDVVAEGARVLREGGLVAFPTDTVYGIAAAADDDAACQRLYGAKERPAARPCAYLLPDRDAWVAHVPALPPLARRLADRWWPGPLTLVVADAEGRLTGLRLPADGLSRRLARAAGRPLLQTSANRSGEPPATDAAGVRAALGDRVDLLLDAGPTPGRLPSTVVEVDARRFALLRAGAIGEEEILRTACDTYLVVCTGNICRSPLAQALLRREVAALLRCEPDEVLPRGYRFLSAGTHAVDGITVTESAEIAGLELNVQLRDHRSRRFDPELLAGARRVYGMERAHTELLQPYFADRPAALALLDPEGGVAKRIRAACVRRAEEIVAASAGPAAE